MNRLKGRKKVQWKMGKKSILAAAAAAIVFSAGMKTSVTFAEAAEEPSVIGGMAEAGNNVETNGIDSQEQKGSILSVIELLGMQDSETAMMFGGGEENWTKDHSFYIGRIFQVDIDGKNYPIYTSCGEDGVVESASIWIVDGEHQVMDSEVEEWEKRVSESMGIVSTKNSEISEGGSQNWTWRKNDTVARMSCMENILTVSFQKAIGELK